MHCGQEEDQLCGFGELVLWFLGIGMIIEVWFELIFFESTNTKLQYQTNKDFVRT